jgi:hypothetical protein
MKNEKKKVLETKANEVHEYFLKEVAKENQS